MDFCAVKRKAGGGERRDGRWSDTAVSIKRPVICHQSTTIHHLCSISCSLLSQGEEIERSDGEKRVYADKAFLLPLEQKH